MKNLLYTLVILPFFFSCSESNDLDETITIYEEGTSLPIYSEWGYNTFGVNYEREAFLSTTYDVPFKVLVDSSFSEFIFKGQISDSYYYGEGAELKFRINGFIPTIFSDLSVLHDSAYNLLDSNIIVTFAEECTAKKLDIIEGYLYFKRVQSLYVDQKFNQLILSGLFSFKALLDSTPVTFSDGRFDFGLDNENFYNLSK